MIKSLFSSLFFIVFVFLVFPVSQVQAKVLTNQSGTVIVPKSEVINDDLFVGGQNVVIDGTINGDVFVGGQSVKIGGVINGSLHVGAMTIDLRGQVKGNIYAGAQTITVTGSKVGGSLFVGAATTDVDKSTSIGGSLFAGAGSLMVDSNIKRNLYAGTGAITLGANTKIGKDLYYATDKNNGSSNISTDAKISGIVKKTEFESTPNQAKIESSKKQMAEAFAAMKFAATIISLLGALIIGFLYFKLFPKHLGKVTTSILSSPWKSLGIGFLTTIAFIPAMIILLITVIGIPVAGIALLVFMLFAYLSKIVVGSALGNALFTRFGWKISVFPSLALGLLVTYLVGLIPVLGFISGLVVFWIGLGALTLNLFTSST